MSRFKKGDMVICLKTPGTPAERATGVLPNGATKWPVVNGIYTVRGLDGYPPPNTGVLLEGIVNGTYRFQDGQYGESSWYPTNFCKIKTPDISALRLIVETALHDAKKKAKRPRTKKIKDPA